MTNLTKRGFLNKDNFAIFKALVGPVSEAGYRNIAKNIEMYMTPDLSIFIPVLDYCDYAISPRHKHPAYSFIYNYTGSCEVRVNELVKSSPFGNKPNICAFSPEVPHEEIVKEQFNSYMAVCISPKFYLRELQNYPLKDSAEFRGDYFEGSEMVLNALKRFIVEHGNNLPCRDKLLRVIALEITHLLIRHCRGLKNSESKISQKVEINQLVSYLNENYAKKVSVDEMAKYVNLSPSHFTRVFKDEIGESPVDFLINLKIQKAKRFLLSREHNMTQIAFACGFSSSAHFASCFSGRVGIAPSEFRKKQSLS